MQMQETYEKSIEAGKKEIRSMLRDASSGNLIILLETIERLGLAYHFETEMKLKLDQIYNFHQDFDLFTTALRFRLLRQNHYQVSCGMSLILIIYSILCFTVMLMVKIINRLYIPY